MNIKRKIEQLLRDSTGLDIKLTEPDPQFGDYATSIAFTLAKQEKSAPKEVASQLVSKFKLDPEFVKEINIAPNGFINLKLNDNFIRNYLLEILYNRVGGSTCSHPSRFGSSNLGQGKKVLVEFVSANPTGPLHVAHGRAASIGDSIVRILNFTGYKAESEYYVNNCGRQIDLLEESIKARLKELRGEKVEFPEEGYKGEYIKEIAQQLFNVGADFICENVGTGHDLSPALKEYGLTSILNSQKSALEKLGVKFNNWVYESEIRNSELPQKVIEVMKKNKEVYEKDGALWLKLPLRGEGRGEPEGDKVLVKSDGEFTYLVPDIAYHLHKLNRGYDLLIDLFGADHLSHKSELITGLSICCGKGFQALIKIIIVQWVTLISKDKKIGMSKRKGEFVTLEELINSVGKDVARFFFLMRKCDSHLDFDMELAKQESKENPVYYVQYACARISSILKLAETQNVGTGRDLSLLNTPEELALMRKLVHFPEMIEQASIELSPHYIPYYLIELATLFHNFYEKHKVVSEDTALTSARLALIEAVRQVLSNGLNLIGIEPATKM